MNKNYDYVSTAYKTKQLKEDLTRHGCMEIKSIRLNNIKSEFCIKKLDENNIFKNSIKIKRNFSEKLIMLLGGYNTQCIYNFDDSLHRNLFAGLVEYEALYQIHNKNNHILGCLLLSCDFADYELKADKFIWTLDRKTLHTSLIEFIQKILNINWMDALATLADILGMNYENIFFF